MIGLYVARRSPLHRLPAGVKLLALVGVGVGVLWMQRWWQVGPALAVVSAGYLVARLDLRTMGAQVRPVLWVVAAIGAFQLLASGWERAVVVTGQLVTLVLAAALVTVTTRTSDLLDVVVRLARPLRVVGVDPQRLGLLLALSIRAIPMVVETAGQVRDAQRARGLTASPRAFAVPLLVRSLRRADALGEALAARGADD
ncbi:MAG: energy-coupling factor transporter transmembrane protein EcfT [Streptosporangiales bacterium]|nr:energy-coupling factor transporter transmembrane protein EcfT [Streptosporangiales bacterium]